MKTWTMVYYINHILATSLIKDKLDLGSFRLPCMPRLAAGQRRVWRDGRWWREMPTAESEAAPATPTAEREAAPATPEIPEEIFILWLAGDLLQLPEFGLTQDKASWNVAACHQIRSAQEQGGMGCNGEDVDDFYHESWNAFKMSMDRTGLSLTAIQLWHVFTCNHHLINKSLHKQKRREGMAEWVAMNPVPPVEWAEVVEAAATAGGQAPASSQELDGFFDQQVTDNADARIAGPPYRMSAWFGIIPCIRHRDGSFVLFRQWTRWFAQALLGDAKFCSAMRNYAAKELAAAADGPQEESKSDHKA
jgi:hypothetical protein